ncbi:hypothetical protein SAMN05444172_2574 [Burkholderia sp. GAS332]|nr:hypothetical protein SAMN05444172_2574 [Burkholderia sp. GAS332]
MQTKIFQQQDVNFRQVQEVCRLLPDAIAEIAPGAAPDTVACMQGMASAITGAAPFRFLCVVEGDGEIRGFLAGVLETDAFTSLKVGRVIFQYVRPAYRQSGALAELVSSLEGWAKDGGARAIDFNSRAGAVGEQETKVLSDQGFERGGIVLRKLVPE